MTHFFRRAAAAFPALLLAAAPAGAVTVITQPGSAAAFAAPAGGAAITFDDALPTGFVASYADAAIVQGSVWSLQAQPGYSDGSRYLAVSQGGVATIAATAQMFDSVSFFLGSIDAFNAVDLLDTSGALIASYSGADFTADANGDQSLPATNRRVTLIRGAGDAAIGGVRFRSSGQALEVDNIVFTVPEPSTWALLLLGFGLIAVSVRYRRKGVHPAIV